MPVLFFSEFFIALFLFLLAMFSRAACNIGFAERPLVLGFLWGLATGEYAIALPLAIFFELFWLDLFPIGSYLPPMAAFPYLILMALSSHYQWDSPSRLSFPLALVLPLAYVTPYIEMKQRNFQAAGYMRLMHQARHRSALGTLPGKILAASIAQQCFFNLAAFFGVLTGILVFFQQQNVFQTEITPLTLDWPVLYCIAAIGALMALRIVRAYMMFALFMLCIMVYSFL